MYSASDMIRRLLAALPPGIIRFLGRLQFRVPFLRPVIQWAARRLTAQEGVIKYGVGAGLRFHSAGIAGYLLGTSEPEEQALIAKLLNPSDTFYDIGANVGFYSVIAARLVGPHGHVYAFEPFAPSANIARSNARRNGFENVTVVEAAVMAGEGSVYLRTSPDRESTHYSVTANASGEGVHVPAVSIDTYAPRHRLRAPNLVKIDVEGGELDALSGMLLTLKRHRPIVICEIHWTTVEFVRFFDEHLRELGYTAVTLRGDELPIEPSRFHTLMRPARLPDFA